MSLSRLLALFDHRDQKGLNSYLRDCNILIIPYVSPWTSFTLLYCIMNRYAVCPYPSSHFSNASTITRILPISLSLPQIVVIRCWGVNPNVSPKTRRMRSIQTSTRFHNVSAMRLSSMSEKSSPMV